MQDDDGIKAAEVHGADVSEAMACGLAGDLALQPIEHDAWREKLVRAGFSESSISARTESRASCEAARIAADLSYNEYKRSGRLRRDEDERALDAQIKFGDAR